MRFKQSEIKKILLISLTNIGDVILTFPVFDALRASFPGAKMSLVIGPKAESLFQEHPGIEKIYIYDKKQAHIKTIQWMFELWKERFDLVVDLRNTAIPFLIFPKYRTPLQTTKENGIHMKQKHLKRLRTVIDIDMNEINKSALFIPLKEKALVESVLKKKIGAGKYVVFAPGSAFHAKRWSAKGFAEVADYLIQQHGVKTVFVGDDEDKVVVEEIEHLMKNDVMDLCGKISLVQLAELLRNSMLAIVNDSAPMHLASYLNIPVLALFGPSDPNKYGPWGENCVYLSTPTAGDEISAIASETVIQTLDIRDGVVSFRKP